MNALETRIPPPVVALICIALVWFTRVLLPNPALPSLLSNGVAIVLFCFAGLMVVGAVSKFRKSGTTMDPMNIDKSSRLITEGVFAWSRNPMYVSLTSLIASFVAWTNSSAGLLILLLFVVYITRFQIIPEERAMQKLFASDYLAYRMRTRRWL
jgi:protein-S-isoprenylcysteine O-methyltransferase Ste14